LKAHRLLNHSTLGLRVIKKKKEEEAEMLATHVEESQVGIARVLH